MKDITGRDIMVGDKVVVAQRKGSSSYLKEYVVAAFDYDAPDGTICRPILEHRPGARKFVLARDSRAIAVVESSHQ
jgi:hypothetical protein